MINRLKYAEIDFVAYERCLNNSAHQNFYARREILDLLCDTWELLTYGDYDYVMPIPLRRKFGLKFVAMPVFIQQLGVFGAEDREEINQLFIQKLISSYSVFNYAFNQDNSVAAETLHRKNYIITRQPYEQLKKNFSKGRKSVLKKRTDAEVLLKKPDQQTFDFIASHFKGLSHQHEVESFLDFTKEYAARLKFRHVYSRDQLICVAIFTETEQSFGLLALINDEKFKVLNAASYLIDEFLKEEIANKALDFMGGNIRGVEVFFKSFGAQMTTYPVIQRSRLQLFKDVFLNE